MPEITDTHRVVWLHSTAPFRLPALGDLAKRLKQQRPDVFVVATSQNCAGHRSPEGIDILEDVQNDLPRDTARTVSKWSPEVCVWAGTDFLPSLIKRMKAGRMRSILCDIAADDVPNRARRWLPDPTRRGLEAFDMLWANDDRTRRALEKLSLADCDIRGAAPLERAASPPGCSDDDLLELKTALVGRPVWLAASVCPAEAETILEAHRAALRLQHRLLLVLSLARPEDTARIRAHLEASNLRFASWDNGELPGDLTQVLLSEDIGDLGLWYRVAALSLMGGTLHPRENAPHPMHPAALGSGVLVGMRASVHTDAIRRLFNAGAATHVSNETDIAETLLERIAPHATAEMALAGWEVATNGAELIDQLTDVITDYLDHHGRQNAGA